MRQLLALGLLAGMSLSVTGCGTGSGTVNMVDLDKVLEIFESTLTAQKSDAAGDAASAESAESADNAVVVKPGAESEVVQAVEDDPTKTDEFLKGFADKLNAASLITANIGVHMQPSGTIEGFIDTNKDMAMMGTDEKSLFTIQIDAEKNRLIASQTVEGQSYNRDRGYHVRPSGFFMGYMLGSMMSRQGSYYSSPGRTKPAFSSMSMNSSGYHKTAVASARSRARTRTSSSGARRGGSRSFRGGK